MKTSNIIALVIFFSYNYLQGQNDRPGEEKIEAQRIAFITQKVNLTPQEAQAFWPLYNEYRAKAKKLQRDKIPPKEIIDMNENEANQYVQQMFDLEQEELNLKKAYHDRLKTVLSPNKILRVYMAERHFRERLLSLMQQRKSPAD